MAKLRKMLGDVNQPEIVRLMRMIETQSKETLAGWALDCAEERYLPICADHESNGGEALIQAIQAVRECLAGRRKAADLKAYLSEAAQTAKDAEGRSIEQAAARAVSTACAVIRTPTNALGFVFYGAAARAYAAVGLEESAETYDALATEEFRALIELLEKVMIADEKKPAKIKWNC